MYLDDLFLIILLIIEVIIKFLVVVDVVVCIWEDYFYFMVSYNFWVIFECKVSEFKFYYFIVKINEFCFE